jgi:hypothetical protein
MAKRIPDNFVPWVDALMVGPDQKLLTGAELEQLDQAAIGTAAEVTGLTTEVSRVGPFVRLLFTLDAVPLAVTDGDGSGSFASLQLFAFSDPCILVPYVTRQDYTDFVEGAALTSEDDDAAFEIGVGSAPIEGAADGALSDDEDDIGTAISIDRDSGPEVDSSAEVVNAVIDGSAAAPAIYLNWSGSAATIDDDDTLLVSGSIEIVAVVLGANTPGGA